MHACTCSYAHELLRDPARAQVNVDAEFTFTSADWFFFLHMFFLMLAKGVNAFSKTSDRGQRSFVDYLLRHGEFTLPSTSMIVVAALNRWSNLARARLRNFVLSYTAAVAVAIALFYIFGQWCVYIFYKYISN
jgi:hypothetical protein